MKRNFYRGLLLLVGFPLVFGACNKDDDPAPDPIVGTWKRDVYRLKDLPANFSNYEAFPFDTYYYGSVEEGMTLTITNDKNYSRKFDLYLNPDVSEGGTWTKEGTKLTLKSTNTDFGEEEFTIEGDITAASVSMVLSQAGTFTLLPDAVTDTLTTAWANAHPDTVTPYQQSVDLTVELVFDKVTTP